MSKVSFRQINTQLFTALIGADITRACYKVLFVVIHFTLGYNQRTEAEISLSTFSAMTSLSRPAVKHALKLLENKNMLNRIRKADNRNSPIYNLNTNFGTWVTGEAHLPLRTTKTYPPDVQNLPSRGEVPTPATTYIKKERKPLKKEYGVTNSNKSFDEEEVTDSSKSGSKELEHPQGLRPGEGHREELKSMDSASKLGDVLNRHKELSTEQNIEVIVSPCGKPIPLPVRVSSRPRPKIEWPADLLQGDANDRECAILDILFVLDDGQAPGRPPELVGNLESILNDNPSADTLELIRQWFEYDTNEREVKDASF